MVEFKLAANLSFLFNESKPVYLEKYRLAADLGFKFIESMFPPSDVSLTQLEEAQSKYDLRQVLINTEVDDNMGYAAVKGKESLFRSSLEKTIQYANTLHIPSIHIMSGKARSDPKFSDPEAYATFKSNLTYACSELNRHSLTALIEPINAYSMSGYYLNDVSLAERLIRELNAEGVKNLKLQLDFFHTQLICGDLTNVYERNRDIIGHIQVAQVPERGEPQRPGEIDYKYVFEMLKKWGYTGYIGLEYKPVSKTEEGVKQFLEKFEFKL